MLLVFEYKNFGPMQIYLQAPVSNSNSSEKLGLELKRQDPQNLCYQRKQASTAGCE